MNARAAAPYWQPLILQALGACSLIRHPPGGFPGLLPPLLSSALRWGRLTAEMRRARRSEFVRVLTRAPGVFSGRRVDEWIE